MKLNLHNAFSKFYWLMVPALLLAGQVGWSQCNNVSSYGSGTISTAGAVVTISTCSYAGEYSTVSGALAGQTLRFTSSVATDWITVRSGTPGGAVLAFGPTPLTFVNTFTGTVYPHWSTDAACGTQSACRTTTVQCTSCAPAGCVNGTLYPGTISLAPTNSNGALQTITTCQFASEYHILTTVLSGKSYTSASSVSTDWITVRVGSVGGAILAQGLTPLTYTTSSTSDLYVHINTNSSCGTNSSCRTTTVQCGGCIPITCTNTTSYGSADLNTGTNLTGVAQPIASCTFAGEYGTVTNALSGKSYTFTSTIGTDFFTLRSGTFNGPVVASGTTPLVYTPSVTGTFFLHVNTNSSCGTNSTCRNTAVQCTNCVGAPPCLASPTSPANGANAGCPNTTQTLTWPVSSGATGYDVYFGTSATPPFYATTATNSLATTSLAQGTYYWQVRPKSAGGTASGCAIWSFTKTDVTPPIITCPANISGTNLPATACSRVVTYTIPTVSDNCGLQAGQPTLFSGLASGATYPVGVTTNVWRAIDLSNNTMTCSFTVTVTDATLPNITCPANIAKNNDVGVCGSSTSYTTPTATDNCGIAAGSPSLQSGLVSGSIFPVGVTTNVWKATDLSNNTRTCSFTVTVTDNEKPKIACPPGIVKGNDFGSCGASIQQIGSAYPVTDNCVVQSVTNNGLGFYPVGTTTVVWTARDNSNNTSTCSQLITVEDNEFPVLICPSNINVKTNVGDCVATVGYAANASDNCAGVMVEYDSSPNSNFNLGLTNVTVTATDLAGHSVNCYFQISVTARPEICNGFDDDCDGLTDEAQDWARIAKQFGSDGASLDEYGVRVAIDGDYAIVGSNKKGPSGQGSGTAYILFRDKNGPNAWGQIAVLTDPGGMPGDNFGASVAISGGVAAVGSPFDDTSIGNEGSVSIFYQSASNPAQWIYQTKATIPGADGGDLLGTSVALSGDQLIAGATGDDASGANAGAAYIFSRNMGGADNWGQVAKLLATTGNANDNFGISVDIDDKYAIVGANGVDGFQQDVGAAYIYGKNQFGPNTWGQVAKLQASVQNLNDNFGVSVGISGPWALVGADRHDRKTTDAGAVFAFYKNNNGIIDSWGQRSIIIDLDGKTGDRFGCAVDIDGPYAVVGAKGDDNQFGDDSGVGFVYLQEDNGWILMGNLSDGGGKAGDALGSSAAISGRNAILGAPLDDNPGSNMGSVLVYGGLCNDLVHPDDRDVPVEGAEASLRCFPVPFSSVLNIEVQGLTTADAQVVVINTLGQTVARLYRGAIEGDMAFQWRPYQVASGVYFLRVSTPDKVLTQTIMLNN